MDEFINKASKIRLVVFDVDGVLTNGSLVFGENGNEYKIFHVHDGLGLVMLKDAGFHVAVISARTSTIVTERMAALGIDLIYQGQKNKRLTLNSLMQELNITKAGTAYIGDDLVDLPAMSQAGLAIAVANAHPRVIADADWVTTKAGGEGAVREICELLLEAQGLLEACYESYSSI